MTLRSKPFSVNEKVILYVLILIMLPFLYAFPATLYISSYRFISPCTGVQSNYHDLIFLFIVAAVLGGLPQVLSMWLGVKFRLGIFWTVSLYLIFKLYTTYNLVKDNIMSPCDFPIEYERKILWPYDLQAFILLGPDIVSCAVFLLFFIVFPRWNYWISSVFALLAFVGMCLILLCSWGYVRGFVRTIHLIYM